MKTLQEYMQRKIDYKFIEGWGAQLYVAQLQPKYGDFDRVKAGPEQGIDDDHLCHDCGAINGEYHVPGCDCERCPKCGGQWISCDCRFTAQGKMSKESIETLFSHEIECEMINFASFIENGPEDEVKKSLSSLEAWYQHHVKES